MAWPMEFVSTPYYCEENVWQLCQDPRVDGDPRAVLFISNAVRQVAVGHQRASDDPHVPVFWDYHVVLATRRAEGWVIWDPDSTLRAPAPLSLYLRASLGFPEGAPEPYTARFRIIEASCYRTTLATDRRHMREPDGRLRAPAPPWEPIGEGSNLMRLVDLDDDIVGEVVDLDEVPAALARLEG